MNLVWLFIVSCEPDKYGKMALKITNLAGYDLIVGATETLIMNLYKRGILTKGDAISLVSMHLREARLYSTPSPSS